MYVAYFHGVDNAEEIKELIQERMRRFSDAGLGDPDDSASHEPEETAPSGPSELLLVAREFAVETGALRAAISAPPASQAT